MLLQPLLLWLGKVFNDLRPGPGLASAQLLLTSLTPLSSCRKIIVHDWDWNKRGRTIDVLWCWVAAAVGAYQCPSTEVLHSLLMAFERFSSYLGEARSAAGNLRLPSCGLRINTGQQRKIDGNIGKNMLPPPWRHRCNVCSRFGFCIFSLARWRNSAGLRIIMDVCVEG